MQGPSQPSSFSDLSRVLAPEKPGCRRKGGGGSHLHGKSRPSATEVFFLRGHRNYCRGLKFTHVDPNPGDLGHLQQSLLPRILLSNSDFT